MFFPYLYGSQTIQRNQLALTDEDTSEYRMFEMITSMVPNYKQSKVMLCTFHAIWKYFKEHIRPTLPKEGILLSETGRKCGENENESHVIFTCMLLSDIYTLFTCHKVAWCFNGSCGSAMNMRRFRNTNNLATT